MAFSEEARQKISKSLIGNKRRLGIPHTEETKRKIAAKSKGRIVSIETRDKLRKLHLGIPMSDVAKFKPCNSAKRIKIFKINPKGQYELCLPFNIKTPKEKNFLAPLQ